MLVCKSFHLNLRLLSCNLTMGFSNCSCHLSEEMMVLPSQSIFAVFLGEDTSIMEVKPVRGLYNFTSFFLIYIFYYLANS